MSTIHLHQTTTSTPEQYVAGLTDFGPGRSKLFGNSADEYLKVHHRDRSQADVTEGSGGIWERLHYDWSDPNRVVLTTTDSNVWGGDSGHTYTFTRQPNGTIDVDVVVVREGKNLKGRVLAIVLGTIGKRALGKALAKTVKAIEARSDGARAAELPPRARRADHRGDRHHRCQGRRRGGACCGLRRPARDHQRRRRRRRGRARANHDQRPPWAYVGGVMDLLERAPVLDELDGVLAKATTGGRVVLLAGEAGLEGEQLGIRRSVWRALSMSRAVMHRCEQCRTEREPSAKPANRPLTCTNRPANRSRRPDLPAREPPVSRRGTNTAALTCSPTLTRLDRVLAGPMRSLCRSLRRWARRRRSTVPPVATSSPPERSAPP